jgi:alpha-L-rhamnosidase
MSKYFLLFFSTIMIHTACFAQQVTIQNLLCESVNSPLAIDTKLPRLSWQLQSKLKNTLQAAYQILVASTPEKLKNNMGDLWDSKKQISDNSILIAYNGSTLKSTQTCYWKVKVWANNGIETPWSNTASWEMGLLNKTDWQAEWIGYDGIFSEAEKPDDRFTRVAARYARKDFSVPKTIKKAIAYISGVGLYELYLNGNKIGNQVLAPGPTDYAKRVFYNTFDVTAKLKNGNNAAGVILGNGRFVAIRQHLEDTTNNCVNYGFPKLLMQIQITFEDGSTQFVKTDSRWMISGDGPIISNNEFDGEEYDATKEFKDWAKPGFITDARWKPVQLTTAAAPIIQSQLNPPITIAQTMKPRTVTQPKPGMFVFNMAQNMVGWVQLKVSGARGTKVRMRFAERLEEDGTIYTGNLGDARVTDIYTLKGEGIEIWEPGFTYHGFQYVEVTGFPGTPTLENIEGKVVHDNMEVIGKIETSNEVLNKIYHNMYWGIRSNYRGMPTDCPQRDERMGWLGDRAAVGKGESFMFNTHLFYAKWMQDIEDAQNEAGSIPDVAPAYWRMYTNNTTWPSAYVYNIDMLYQQFGDAAPIQRHYLSIKKWLYFLKSHFMKEGIITENTYGDWCVPPETLTLIFSNDPNRKTPGDYLSTAFYYDMLNIMIRFAGIINNKKDIAFFKEEAKKTKTAFNKKFFNSTQNYYANNTTTANVLALAFNLVPDNLRKKVFARIVDKTMSEGKGHITTGLIGIQQLMRTLTHNGRPDIAYLLATTTSYPSWGYMLTQGATSIWELWNGNTAGPAMNSANHVMMIGDLLTWYYEDLAGIKAAAPAFKIIEMKPIATPDLKFVNANYQCPQGLIASNRSMDANGFKWQIEIPANTKAVVYIPAISSAKIKENGTPINLLKDIKQVGKTTEYVLLKIGSGKYNFSVE